MKRRGHQPQPTAAGDQIELADLQEPLATGSPASTPALPEDLPEAAAVTQPLGKPDDPTASSPEQGRAQVGQARETICWTHVLACLLFLLGLIAILFKMTLGANDIATDLLAGMSYLSGGESFCEYRFPEFI